MHNISICAGSPRSELNNDDDDHAAVPVIVVGRMFHPLPTRPIHRAVEGLYIFLATILLFSPLNIIFIPLFPFPLFSIFKTLNY